MMGANVAQTGSAISDLIALCHVVRNTPEEFLQHIEKLTAGAGEAQLEAARAQEAAQLKVNEAADMMAQATAMAARAAELEEKAQVDGEAARTAVKDARAMKAEAEDLLAEARNIAARHAEEHRIRMEAIEKREKEVAVREVRAEGLMREYETKVSQISAIANQTQVPVKE